MLLLYNCQTPLRLPGSLVQALVPWQATRSFERNEAGFFPLTETHFTTPPTRALHAYCLYHSLHFAMPSSAGAPLPGLLLGLDQMPHEGSQGQPASQGQPVIISPFPDPPPPMLEALYRLPSFAPHSFPTTLVQAVSLRTVPVQAASLGSIFVPAASLCTVPVQAASLRTILCTGCHASYSPCKSYVASFLLPLLPFFMQSPA